MSKKYKILHLEDVATDAELAARELKKSNLNFNQLIVDTEHEYVNALEHYNPDIILCDHSLASFNSREALKIFKAKKLAIPFLLITATLSDEVAISVLKEGADDYILKDHLARLPNAVINAIEKYRLNKERKQLIKEANDKEALSKKRLADLSSKLLLATKAAGVGIWEYIIETGEFIVDEVMLSIYGVKDFDGTFETWKNYLHPVDAKRLNKNFKADLKKVVEFDFEFRIIHPDSSVRFIQASAIVERDTNGKRIRMVGTNQNVTKRKEAEKTILVNISEREALIRELTNSIKDLKLFTYITSHNFRAPLSNLIGLLRFVDYSTLTENNHAIIEMFTTSTEQLNKTVNDLLKILIIKNNVNVELAYNNVNQLLASVTSSLAHEMEEIGCVISKNIHTETIVFNTAYLESILTNLFSNAIKYRSPDRSLQIVVFTKLQPNGDVVLSIKDNGLGIDLKMHKDNIFGLYQRFHTNSDSVGLGLFIVKSQINALGGSIEVESEVDKGTTFIITFKNKAIHAATMLPVR
jgi:signal transduction histidine kinase/FixJ family two-component response regulator